MKFFKLIVSDKSLHFTPFPNPAGIIQVWHTVEEDNIVSYILSLADVAANLSYHFTSCWEMKVSVYTIRRPTCPTCNITKQEQGEGVLIFITFPESSRSLGEGFLLWDLTIDCGKLFKAETHLKLIRRRIKKRKKLNRIHVFLFS